MSTGLPVIVSKTAGAAEVLEDKENALLVNPGFGEEIAAGVRHLIGHPGEYLRLSRNGRKFVEHNLSWRNLADKMEGIFRGAC